MAGKRDKPDANLEEVKKVKIWAEALADITEKMSGWERNFTENINDRLDRDEQLSDAQMEKLEELYRKYY